MLRLKDGWYVLIKFSIFFFSFRFTDFMAQWWADDGDLVKSVIHNGASANTNMRERLFDAQNYPPQNPYDTYYSGSYNPYQVGYE